ncbi:hypothetical protein ASG52_15895 [Methylobacterium sp. Leaf456]|nr:hypothetical protein ASG52_15895 [Methylobacterium sp. Leaf456]
MAGAADAAHPSGATPTEGEPEAILSSLPSRLADGSAAPDLAWRIGLKLWRSGRAQRAAEAFALAYAHGCRDLGFLRDHLGLLTGETRYREVIDVAVALRRDGFADHPSAASRLAMLVGHARLALAHPRDVEIARAAERAASPVWLDPPTLLRAIAAAIAERRPFAFTRLGDGEARYLLGEAPVETSGLTDEEALAMGDLVWENWFGAPLSAVDADRRADLHAAFVDAVRSADVVGVCSHERLRADTGHYGYLAWQEAWLRNLDGGSASRLFTDAQVHYRLNAEAPFLATLLEGQDILSVISPHPGCSSAAATSTG